MQERELAVVVAVGGGRGCSQNKDKGIEKVKPSAVGGLILHPGGKSETGIKKERSRKRDRHTETLKNHRAKEGKPVKDKKDADHICPHDTEVEHLLES